MSARRRRRGPPSARWMPLSGQIAPFAQPNLVTPQAHAVPHSAVSLSIFKLFLDELECCVESRPQASGVPTSGADSGATHAMVTWLRSPEDTVRLERRGLGCEAIRQPLIGRVGARSPVAEPGRTAPENCENPAGS